MQVVHLIKYDTGGAAKACLRLHLELLKQGVESRVLVLYKTQNDEKLIDFRDYLSFSKNILYKIKNKVFELRNERKRKTLPFDKELFSFPDSPWKVEDHPLVKSADIIHLHWVSEFVNVSRFLEKVKKPVFWTFHDQEPYSNGYHYKLEEEECYNPITQSGREIRMKNFNGQKLNIVFPSNWLKSDFKKSVPTESKHKLIHLPNGIEPKQHKFIQQKEALIQLGLDEKTKHVLFISNPIDYERKGLNYLLSALGNVDQEFKLLLLGQKRSEIPGLKEIPHHFLGSGWDSNQMHLIYSAASIYVNPSLADNLPNTIMEALAAGCSVVAFNSGGIPELKRKNLAFYGVERKNAKELGSTINTLLGKKPDRNQIANESVAAFDIKAVSRELINHYREAIDNQFR